MAADILFIGSDLSSGSHIRTVLETVGYTVQPVPTFQEALDVMDPQTTHLIFIDTTTAGLGLGEQIASVQAVNSNIEFVLLADFQDPILEQEAKDCGVTSWLYRPVTAPEIILRVASALEMGSIVGRDGVAEEQDSHGDREETIGRRGEETD